MPRNINLCNIVVQFTKHTRWPAGRRGLDGCYCWWCAVLICTLLDIRYRGQSRADVKSLIYMPCHAYAAAASENLLEYLARDTLLSARRRRGTGPGRFRVFGGVIIHSFTYSLSPYMILRHHSIRPVDIHPMSNG